MLIKVWVDDVRPKPNGYHEHIKTVNMFKIWLDLTTKYWKDTIYGEEDTDFTMLIDLDHDAGEYQYDGGDYIKILDWLESEFDIEDIPNFKFIFTIHSANPVGRENMLRIIRRNDWEYI